MNPDSFYLELCVRFRILCLNSAYGRFKIIFNIGIKHGLFTKEDSPYSLLSKVTTGYESLS